LGKRRLIAHCEEKKPPAKERGGERKNFQKGTKNGMSYSRAVGRKTVNMGDGRGGTPKEYGVTRPRANKGSDRRSGGIETKTNEKK